VFEARLHPDSYRTVECKEGSKCTRKICFFYHNERERRIPTGLQDARAQLTAELGESAFELSPEALRASKFFIYIIPAIRNVGLLNFISFSSIRMFHLGERIQVSMIALQLGTENVAFMQWRTPY
jgi:hypothetical protein